MITVIDSTRRKTSITATGTARHVLTASDDKTRVEVARFEVEAGKTHHVAPSDRTQVVYVEQGTAEITFTTGGKATTHQAQRGCGVYLEPQESAAFKGGTPLALLSVTVPKHTGKALDATGGLLTGYYFDEAELQTLVDEKRIRIRTFWVNKETGLSRSWDMQLGRMLYGPKGHSPRHVHHASNTSPVVPEHFYFIETGTGEVKHDGGTLPVGPGTLVLIPSGEWHQLVASDSGFNYIEFQAPFDFVTTMDHDPLGKNWYIQGTEDSNGNLKRWVQS